MFRGYTQKTDQRKPLDELIQLFQDQKSKNTAWKCKFIAEFEDPLDQDRMDALINLDACTASGLTDIGKDKQKKDLVAAIALIEGYKTLSERTVSVLMELSGQGSSELKTLAEAAAQARQALFIFLRQQEQDNIPSGFDKCQSLFLEFLDQSGYLEEYQVTEDLFRDYQTQVSSIDKLIKAWGEGISQFIADAQQTNPYGDNVEFGDPMAIANFFCMHDCVETLYARLVTNVSGNE